jgi:preprotein translocase subunit YajC
MTLSSLTLLAQDAAKPAGGILGSGPFMMVLMVIMFYFLLIRPQQRQRKELEKRISALQKGDRVVTTAGLHGLVHNVGDKTVTLKVAEGVMLEFDKPAVATVLKKETAVPAESK